MIFFKISNEIKLNRKKCNEFYSRLISQKFSHYFSSMFILLKIPPNVITILMGLLILPISSALYFSDDFSSIFISFSLILINILDTSDGEVARFLNKSSRKGEFYDKFFQIFADLILIFTLYIKFYNNYENITSFLILLYLLVYIINVYLKRLAEIYVDKKNKLIKKNLITNFLSNISSNTFFFHSLWILFVFKFYMNPSSFEIISIIYFFNLIFLNSLKSIVLFKNISFNLR